MDDTAPPRAESASPSGRTERSIGRRAFLVGATSLGAALTVSGGTFVTEDGRVGVDPWLRPPEDPDSLIPSSLDDNRHWLGPHLWGNRLQDWQYDRGRIECLCGDEGYEIRTVGVLTRELVSGEDSAHLRVRTGIVDGADGADSADDTDDGGFCGFLVGVGNGELDYRAAALAQRSSGTGGGLLCTYETGSQVQFREHTDEENPVSYDELPPDDVLDSDEPSEPAPDEAVRLSLDVLPQSNGRFSLVLKALDADSGALLSGAVREGVPERELLGGIALVSSPYPGQDGARWWFDQLQIRGEKVTNHPQRTFGPIVGTLFSVADSVLKLTAQLVPLSDTDPKTARLHYRPADGGKWRTEQSSIEPGYVTSFRVEDWNATRAWEYRVAYRDASGDEWQYEGRIDAEPSAPSELTVGVLGCTNPCVRRLDSGKPMSKYPDLSIPGRYTSGNVYFPYETLSENVRSHRPDLLVFNGDQIYEDSPTEPAGRRDPDLDYLYKWYLWLWSFRDLTRETPTIVLIDDHDVYQPNVWGEGGEKLARGKYADGGYVGAAEFVNTVQRTQCGHNPDPYDLTPVERGISVYYGGFTYGGTSFAMLEDRKFKSGPDVDPPKEADKSTLLGERQLAFLSEWSESDSTLPKLCLTQTCFAAACTTPKGKPMRDPDTNGYPKPGRDRAIDLLRDAGALVLSGDQHLATLVRHGIDDPTDAVVQFTIPAGGATFQRWFEPADDLPNGRGRPNTGEFTDAFGNQFRMLAVANPQLSFQALMEAQQSDRKKKKKTLYDREQKREGYGIVRVDYDAEAFVIECWPWSADSTDADAEQFPGWPYRLPFDETNG